jgi:uncharacterized protein YegP (UPF0339 family)
MGKFVITKSENGSFHFNLKAGNGEIILASEAYNSRAACENGMESVRKMPRKTRTTTAKNRPSESRTST